MNPSVTVRRSQTSQWRPMLTSIKNSTGSIVAPIAQDVLDLGIAKAEEAQGSPVVLHRMKSRMNFSHVDAQLPPALARTDGCALACKFIYFCSSGESLVR